MIKKIRVRGLGPHVDTEVPFDALGVSEVTGPSEVGKSTLIDAVCFALWGFDRTGKALDLRAMHDDATEVRVDMEIASGSILTRSLRRAKGGGRGKIVRTIRRADGSETEHSTEKSWLGALRDVGARPAVLRHVLVPMAWVALAEGMGGGRPLRDLLAEILPKASAREVVEELLEGLGFELLEGDPVNVKDAEAMRTHTKRRASEKKGDVERLEKLVAAGEADAPAGPDEAAVQEASRTLEAFEAFTSYDRNLDAYVERETAIGKIEADEIAWDRRREELGDRPTGDAAELDAAKKALDDVRWRLRRLEEERGKAVAALEEADERLDATSKPRHAPLSFADEVNAARKELSRATLAQEKVSDVCPHCDRPGWDGAIDAANEGRRVAVQRVDEAEAAREEATRAAEEQRATDAANIARLVEARKASIAEVEERLEEARRNETAAQGAIGSASASAGPTVAWERARAALGSRPETPSTVPRPTEPDLDRPDDVSVVHARGVVEGATRAEGAKGQRAKDVAALRQTLALEQAALGDLAAEVERLEALVEACRRAPSVAAGRRLDTLGDLGPVSLRLLEKGGVEVLVDGRPYHFASTGRQVVADVWLRDGFRRAIGLGYLPIFVDCAQDVGGQEIPRRPPTAFLYTTGDGGIDVR